MSAWQRGRSTLRTSAARGRAVDGEEGARSVLSIADLYDEVDSVLGRAFPRSRMLWVRGEIQHLSDRTGHCYMDLVDEVAHGDRQAPVLRVKCWRSGWAFLKSSLAREGVELQPGMVVMLRGVLELYRPRAELSFVLAELDVAALLGRLAAQRARLLEQLQAEGLLERNRSVPLVPVPQRIGLVASPGTEGYRDFLGQLSAAGWAFDLVVAPAVVQGRGAPLSIADALRRLREVGRDLVVVVRGGGSRGDLAAFDTEVVARAIATMPMPVWTGIGHSGDEAVADLVAARALATPTACGREIVSRVVAWWDGHVAAASQAIGDIAGQVVADEERRALSTRAHLAGVARHQLRWHRERLGARASSLGGHAVRALDSTAGHLHQRSARFGPMAFTHVQRAQERVDSWRRLVAAYDVERQLERGYTLTLDEGGHILRSAHALGGGDVIVTRFTDGSLHSVVAPVRGIGRTDRLDRER